MGENKHYKIGQFQQKNQIENNPKSKQVKLKMLQEQIEDENIQSSIVYHSDQIFELKIKNCIETNKKDLKRCLIICNFIHNLCFSILSLVELYNYTSLYSNGRSFQKQTLLFNIFFQIPLNLALPVLLGYARDFVNQVATIKISFAIVCIGIIFQNCAMILNHSQIAQIGCFMFILGKEVFFVAGLCLINDYFPQYQQFAIQLSYFSQYGWVLPRIIANVLIIIIASNREINQFVVAQLPILSIILVFSILIEITQIRQILSKQKILEDVYDCNINDHKNPFRKHNIKVTLKKYFKNVDLITVIVSVSLIISIQSFQFFSTFNTSIIGFANSQYNTTPDLISLILSLIHSIADFIMCQIIRRRYQQNFCFEKVIVYFKQSGFISFICFSLITYISFIDLPFTVQIIIAAMSNVFSGFSCSLAFSSIEIIVLKFQADNMIGTGFGLASSFMTFFSTIFYILGIFFNSGDETFRIIALSCLGISVLSFSLQQFIGNKIINKQQFSDQYLLIQQSI